jgi:hypothetical protein
MVLHLLSQGDAEQSKLENLQQEMHALQLDNERLRNEKVSKNISLIQRRITQPFTTV